jgi:hypothetical protein
LVSLDIMLGRSVYSRYTRPLWAPPLRSQATWAAALIGMCGEAGISNVSGMVIAIWLFGALNPELPRPSGSRAVYRIGWYGGGPIISIGAW